LTRSFKSAARLDRTSFFLLGFRPRTRIFLFLTPHPTPYTLPPFFVIAGIACTRKLVDGRCVAQLHKRGQQLRLQGLKFPVYVSWYYFKRDDGKYVKRFIISIKALKASTISWWGKRRWLSSGLV